MVNEAKINAKPPLRLGAEGRYRLRRELGRGTMGVVYEAEDSVLGRVVAVKTIELAFSVSSEARETFERRFFTEARVAAKLAHPGIVVCHDVGKDPDTGTLFIVFEHLHGHTLAERIAQGPLPWREAVAVVLQLARAIQHAHERGVVHRDLKPSNVMLLEAHPGVDAAAAGSVKIMDFGVAKLESADARLTATGQWFGSPAYISPERAMGHPSDARSDIFSLGSILCTLVLGRPWFDAPSIPAILAKVIHQPAPALSGACPGAPAAIDLVAERALAKQPADRYPSAGALAEDLQELLAGALVRHAESSPGGEADPLLWQLSAAAPAVGPGSDPLDALASLVGTGAHAVSPEVTLAAMAPAIAPPSEQTMPAPVASGSSQAVARSGIPAGAAAPHQGGPAPRTPSAVAAATPAVKQRRSPALATIVVLVALAVTLAALLLSRRHPAEDPARVAEAGGTAATTLAPIGPPGTSASPPPAEDEPVAAIAASDDPSPSPAQTAEALEEAGAMEAAAAGPTAPERRAQPPAPRVRPSAPVAQAPAATEAARLGGPPARYATPPPAPTRMRIEIEHPLEDGRLVMWLDGVPVLETKLRAEVARRIVAIKIRKGQVQAELEATPGRHEVRVEVSWDGGRRRGAKVVELAPGATGLLAVRLGNLSKDLTLQWNPASE